MIRPRSFSHSLIPLFLIILALCGVPQAWAAGPGALQVGPIPGLTTAWHPAPAASSVPVGTTLSFRRAVAPGIAIRWRGARETVREAEWSKAELSIATAGLQTVEVEIVDTAGKITRERSSWKGEDLPAGGLRVIRAEASVAPILLDENNLNASTVYYFFRIGSIAALTRLEENRYRTSTLRKVKLNAEVEPSGFAPLLEWTVTGGTQPARVLLGSSVELRFPEPGPYRVRAGQSQIDFEVYRVKITSHGSSRNRLTDGVTETFTAVTDPPGFESEITWLASTSYGSSDPVMGRGPSFTVRFDRTFSSEGHQWLGVRADNSVFNQDQKCDPTDYQKDIPAISDLYNADVPAYWGSRGFPPLARRADQLQSLALDPLAAFGGVFKFLDEDRWEQAYGSGAVPREFSEIYRQYQTAGFNSYYSLMQAFRSLTSELDSLPEGSPRSDEIHSTFGAVYVLAIHPSGSSELAPPPSKAPPAFSCTPRNVCRGGSNFFASDLVPPATDDNDTSTSTDWTRVTYPSWKTTYNGSCATHAVGPSAAVLGILGKQVTCKGWNDLSRDIGATAGKAGAPLEGICTWYRSKGYCCSTATEGFFTSACEEAKDALDRGCDVLFYYNKGQDAHIEKVQSVTVDPGRDTKCTATTLSWGSPATVTYDNGEYSGKSDGQRYRRDGKKSYLEGTGKATFYYYCKC